MRLLRWCIAATAAMVLLPAVASAAGVASSKLAQPRLPARMLITKARLAQPVLKVPSRVLRRPAPTGQPGLVKPVVGQLRPGQSPAALLLGSTGTPWGGSRSLPPATTTGKVFFTDHTGNHWVCSGSLVNSAGKDLVITAGHCVYGTAGGELPSGETWHSNWYFAPDYSNGVAPYGYWSARQLWTMSNYINSGDEQDDIGAAILNTNSAGQHAVNLLGGQGYAWNQSTSHYIWDFGYPQASPFNGQLDEVCTGNTGWDLFIQMEGLSCNFTGGSSGGPWLMSFNGEFGYVNGVNDARYGWPYSGDITSLYFGNNALALYQATQNL